MKDGRAPGSEKVHAALPPQASPKGDSATKRRKRKPLGETVAYSLMVARLNRKDRAHFESCFDWDCIRCEEMFHED